MPRIAVMQPYFLPYAGYFRLMCDVDAFVVFDSVQFPGRGWVHRNRLRTYTGELAWLTLPLAKARVDTAIKDLCFRDTARDEIRRWMRRFPETAKPQPGTRALVDLMSSPEGRPTDFITRLLELTRDILGLSTPIVALPGIELAAEAGRIERLVALCRHFGADTYVNAPGGRSLYDQPTFRQHGITLQFLPDYRGPCESILQRLHESTPAALRREIVDNLN